MQRWSVQQFTNYEMLNEHVSQRPAGNSVDCSPFAEFVEPAGDTVDSVPSIVMPSDGGTFVHAFQSLQCIVSHVFVGMRTIDEKQVHAFVKRREIKCRAITVEPMDSPAEVAEAALAGDVLVNDRCCESRGLIRRQVECVYDSAWCVRGEVNGARAFVGSNFKNDFRFQDLRQRAETNNIRTVGRHWTKPLRSGFRTDYDGHFARYTECIPNMFLRQISVREHDPIKEKAFPRVVGGLSWRQAEGFKVRAD